MTFEPLILDGVSTSLWTDFQAELKVPTMQHEVVGHWRRSAELGADLEGPKPEDVLLSAGDLAVRTETLAPLLSCGQAVLSRVSGAASERDYLLLLADTDGVIIQASGGGEFGEYAKQVLLMEGAVWSEADRGTNAIGTALTTKRPCVVVGPAHYARDYHQLVCYAAPIFDAAGSLVGVLDATSKQQRADASMGLGVIAAAKALEELLRARAYSLAGATVTRALARSLERMNCPVAVIEPPGRVSRMNLPARELFGGANAHSDSAALLGMSFEHLARIAWAGDSAEVVGRNGHCYRVRLEPIESVGRLIAVLAFFEPVRRRPRAHRPSKPLPVAPFSELFSQDPAMTEALRRAARVAPSDLPVMLLAETGTGKELVARGIHRASRRSEGPFVALNCSSVSPTLLASELFGYGPGAFTGAEKKGRDGYFEAAADGTLFLDEVAEMPMEMQAALLRFLEDGAYRRVGETKERHADVRIVCATCRDLPTLVEEGGFRSDLYYRLKGAIVTLPALRHRTDVIPLADELLRRLAARQDVVPAPTFSDEVKSLFKRFAWPGNVRELRSTIDVALVMAAGATTLSLEHLPPDMTATRALAPAPPSLDDAQSHVIKRVLADAAGNVSLAAKRLGIARSTLYRRIRRYGLSSSGDG